MVTKKSKAKPAMKTATKSATHAASEVKVMRLEEELAALRAAARGFMDATLSERAALIMVTMSPASDSLERKEALSDEMTLMRARLHTASDQLMRAWGSEPWSPPEASAKAHAFLEGVHDVPDFRTVMPQA